MSKPYKNILSCVLSALMLSAAFFLPSYFYLFIFFFLVPLFYHILRGKNLNFMRGFLWGVVFFSLHWIVLVPLLYYKAYGALRMLIYPFLVLYGALWTGLWFYCASLIGRKFSRIGWVFITWAYFSLWTQFGLFILNGNMGYCFGCPLLPLAHHPQGLFFLPLAGKQGLFFLLILFQYMVAMVLSGRLPGLKTLFVILIFIVFLWDFFSDADKTFPHADRGVIYVKPLEKNSDDYLHDAQKICEKLMTTMAKDPECTLLIMPESSYPFCLNRHSDVVDMWTDKALGNNVGLIIGSHRRTGKKLFNSLYYIRGGRIIYSYDKNLLFPFIEYIPFNIFNNTWAKNLFLKEPNAFVSNGVDHCDWVEIAPDLIFFPLICFDFYCGNRASLPEGITVLLLVNDSWFSYRYMKNLMFLYARFVACQSRQPILYISHTGGYWINRSGYVQPCSQ